MTKEEKQEEINKMLFSADEAVVNMVYHFLISYFKNT